MTVIFQNRGKQYKANIGEFLKIPYIKGLKSREPSIKKSKNKRISFPIQ